MKTLVLLGLFLASSLGLYAQGGNLEGIVLEENSGFEVIGATIRLTGTEKGTVTDIDGRYQFANLEVGTYKLECSYIGFATKVIDAIEIKEGETLTLDFKLGEGAEDIQTVVVSAEMVKNNESAIVTMEKKATGVLSGISAKQISKAGDANVAAAMKRVSGVTIEGGKYVYVRGLGDRYSKTSLNGGDIPGLDPNKNTVQMDLFPTNLIDNIMVYKTFSPNLPGDFTGGYINIVTKDFPIAFNVNASASMGYNTETSFNKEFLSYKGSSTDWLGMDNGSRAIPELVANASEIPAYAIPSSAYFNREKAEQVTAMTKAFGQDFEIVQNAPMLNHSFAVSIGNQYQLFDRPLGVTASLTYRRNYQNYSNGQYNIYDLQGTTQAVSRLGKALILADNKSTDEVMWGAMFGMGYKLTPNHKLSFMLMHNQSGEKSARMLNGIKYLDPEDRYYTQNTGFLQRGLTTVQLKGKHLFEEANKLEIEWQSSYARSTQENPDLRFFTHRYTEANLYQLKPSSDQAPSRYYRDMLQGNFSNRLDLTLPFSIANKMPSKASVGVSHVYKDRSFTENRYIFDSQDYNFDGNPTSYISNVLTLNADGTAYENFDGTYLIDGLSLRNNYTANQGVLGAYGMLEVNLLDNLLLIAGARVETTKVRFKTAEPTLLNDFPKLDGEQALLNNVDVLPALNLNYTILADGDKEMKVRAAYSRTLARPNFRELAPFASYDVEGGFVLIGNPNLQRSLIDNVDLRWEYYFSRDEKASLSAFYKKFQNPIERTVNANAVTELTFRNVPTAYLVGSELEVSKKLGFIHPVMDDFKLSANFSYIHSRTSIDTAELQVIRAENPDAKSSREMYGQAPYSLNLMLSYKNKVGTSANLVFNMTGAKIAMVNRGGMPNAYMMPRADLGFNVSQEIRKGLNVQFSAGNLLQAPVRTMITYKGEEYDVQSFNPGMNFSLGIKYDFTKY